MTVIVVCGAPTTTNPIRMFGQGIIIIRREEEGKEKASRFSTQPFFGFEGFCPRRREKRLFYYQVSTLRLILFALKTEREEGAVHEFIHRE
jgi:hypothetical protein